MLTIERETPDQPEVQDLLDQADARSASLFPTESQFGSTLADLLAQDVRFSSPARRAKLSAMVATPLSRAGGLS